MQGVLVALSVSVLLATGCARERGGASGGPRSETALLEAVCAAVEKKDVEALMALGYWENVPGDVKAGMLEHLPMSFEYGSPTFSIRKMTEKELKPFELRGKSYEWNMEPVGILEIEGDDKELGSSGIPIGKRDGRYHIATRCPKP
jgi:hypothetical protein